MARDETKWSVEFYKDRRGRSAPDEFIDRLPFNFRRKVRNQIRLLAARGTEMGPPQAEPLTAHKPLWELRPLPHRVIYFLHTGRRFILLHAFRKKSENTKARDIELAKRRMYDFLERE